nr:uncharacterized protein LOC116771510 [Danaus plexippus plexippus]
MTSLYFLNNYFVDCMLASGSRGEARAEGFNPVGRRASGAPGGSRRSIRRGPRVGLASFESVRWVQAVRRCHSCQRARRHYIYQKRTEP